jgi:hypothetical protein
MDNYRVQNIGLGDLIFFSTFILNNHEKNTTIGVNLSKKVLEEFRNNSNNYKKFCFDLLKIILKDFIIKEVDDNPKYTIWNSSTISPTYFYNEKILSEIKNNLLSTELEKIETNNYIVLFTKVRDLRKIEYQNIHKSLYEYLNNYDKKIILIGEQKVLYNKEYKIHGENMIYSLYDDYIEYINPSKIIDLTKKTFDFDDFSITNFLSDFKLINNSFFTIVFGGGGFFCSSLFTGKLLSLTNKNYESIYKSKSFPNIFSDNNNFLQFLNDKIVNG